MEFSFSHGLSGGIATLTDGCCDEYHREERDEGGLKVNNTQEVSVESK